MRHVDGHWDRPNLCRVYFGGELPHINISIYSINTTFYVLFINVIRNSDFILVKKHKNDDPRACRLEISGPGVHLSKAPKRFGPILSAIIFYLSNYKDVSRH